MKEIITPGRKRFINKAILGVLPVLVGGIFVTDFLITRNLSIKVILIIAFIALIVLGLWSAPESREDK